MRSIILLKRCLLLVVLATTLPACSRQPAIVEPPPLDVVISQPVREKIVDWDIYTGNVQSKESVEVRSRVRGEIKDVPFKEGDEITAGTLLFQIDDEPFKADLKQAQGLLASWQAKLKFAEERIAIYQPLAEKGTVSKEEVLQTITAKSEALAGIDTANGKITEANLNIGFCRITSPVDGKVGQALLTKGNMVNASGGDSLLTTVVSVDPMYVYFAVNERAILNYIRVLGESAAKAPAAQQEAVPKIPVELARLTDEDFKFKGIIDFVDNKVDPKTGSVKVRGRFDNPKSPDGRRQLSPGLFAKVRVAIVEPYPAILVADRAILTDQSMKYVLIVNKDKKNSVERIDVKASSRLQPDGLRAVTSGLKGDEWVIVEGVNRAQPGMSVNPKEAPMPARPAGK